jgi:hypothetical protein
MDAGCKGSQKSAIRARGIQGLLLALLVEADGERRSRVAIDVE